MIFAELEYECSYGAVHEELLLLVKENFSTVESGHQGDSWIWVFNGEHKVAIDTFYSMKHQVKSEVNGPLLQKVLNVLKSRFQLNLKEPPELETHESE